MMNPRTVPSNFTSIDNFQVALEALSRIETAIRSWYSDHHSLMILKEELEKFPFGHQNPDLSGFTRLTDNANRLKHQLSFILNELNNAVDRCSIIINAASYDLSKSLLEWRRNQKLAGYGYNSCDPKYLTNLQACKCEVPVEIARHTLTHINAAKTLLDYLANDFVPAELADQIRTLENIRAQFTASLIPFINASFIIVKQPPQVMKTNTKFSAQIRSLIGLKLLDNINMNLSQVIVQAVIINESQANSFAREGRGPSSVIGEILDNTGKMEYDRDTNEFSVIFRNMQLKKVRRAEKKGSESVVDEKFAILFTANFPLIGGINITASTMSLPVTVIVHGNQEPRAWATITWDNGFSADERRLFSTPDAVTWDYLTRVLNTKFTSFTEKPLPVEALNYMARKLIECRFLTGSGSYDSMQLSWTKFCKDNLENRNFTFWDWFYAIMKLIADRLKNLWKDGTIIGFISKKDAEEMLRPCCDGTFLLRFSDSELGGISIAFVQTNSLGERIVTSVSPYSSNELAIRSLPNRLYDEEKLLYLYPDIPKYQAFGKYYTSTEPQSSPTDPYAKRSLREVIVGGSKNQTIPPLPGSSSMSQSRSDTPHSTYHAHSPTDQISVFSDHQSFSGADETFSESMDDFEDMPPLNHFTAL